MTPTLPYTRKQRKRHADPTELLLGRPRPRDPKLCQKLSLVRLLQEPPESARSRHLQVPFEFATGPHEAPSPSTSVIWLEKSCPALVIKEPPSRITVPSLSTSLLVDRRLHVAQTRGGPAQPGNQFQYVQAHCLSLGAPPPRFLRGDWVLLRIRPDQQRRQPFAKKWSVSHRSSITSPSTTYI
ncbi:hypothetical protein ILUMI_13222 [Ignelater luminosus]|uniref:Uncharacterized protein n=1 Tax=Ignelater luminosus TaxID=2038154 RepID=A0A8K0GBM2_IGNLU|nr:hypothetical protein ILUMI_13222 [Ignelater luminosus]